MKQKINLALIFGGPSAENEVSVQSAKSIYAAFDKRKYRLIFVGISRAGQWYRLPSKTAIAFLKSVVPGTPVTACPDLPQPMVVDISRLKKTLGADVAFPLIHGPFGEDGTIQALFKAASIPFVGSGVLSSAACMDKDVTKRLLREAGLPTARALIYQAHEVKTISFATVKKALGLPVFVKPANMGSSIGVSRALNEKEFAAALKAAFRYDRKVVIEEAIAGREIECAVLGNAAPKASLPGEVVAQKDFYSYDAKYVLADGAALKIPAELPKAAVAKIQAMALRAYAVMGCAGLARVDFFLKKDGGLVVNEINTIPGFVSGVSMYPMLWQASGLPYPKLVDELVALALSAVEEGGRDVSSAHKYGLR